MRKIRQKRGFSQRARKARVELKRSAWVDHDERRVQLVEQGPGGGLGLCEGPVEVNAEIRTRLLCVVFVFVHEGAQLREIEALFVCLRVR